MSGPCVEWTILGSSLIAASGSCITAYISRAARVEARLGRTAAESTAEVAKTVLDKVDKQTHGNGGPS